MAKKDWLYKEMKGTLWAQSDINVQADFVVPIDDTLVSPYRHGDYLLIRAQPDVFEGELGLFIINGKSHIKIREEKFLTSLNSNVPPVPLDDTAQCRGKVVGRLNAECVEKIKPAEKSNAPGQGPGQ